MKGYEQSTYGEKVSSFYDELHPGALVTEECVSALAKLAGPGPVLELGVGTGRLAIPLAERGLEIDGVDCSPAMLERLRSKPGGEQVGAVLGDFAELAMGRAYRLVVVAADTLFLLSTQDEQVRCFERVAEHLEPDGVFVVEAFVPDKARAVTGGLAVRRVGTNSVVLGASVHDPVRQLIDGQQILIDTDGIKLAPGRLRYAWPSELDLMARLAGLCLRVRWNGWQGEAFTAAATRHISVYGRAGAGS